MELLGDHEGGRNKENCSENKCSNNTFSLIK